MDVENLPSQIREKISKGFEKMNVFDFLKIIPEPLKYLVIDGAVDKVADTIKHQKFQKWIRENVRSDGYEIAALTQAFFQLYQKYPELEKASHFFKKKEGLQFLEELSLTGDKWIKKFESIYSELGDIAMTQVELIEALSFFKEQVSEEKLRELSKKSNRDSRLRDIKQTQLQEEILNNMKSNQNKGISKLLSVPQLLEIEQRMSLFAEEEEWDKIIIDWEKIKQTDKDYTKHRQLVARAYLKRGEYYLGVKNFERALNSLQESIALYSLDAEAYLLRGKVKIELVASKQEQKNTSEDFEKIIADFSKAVELDNKLTQAYFYRGRVHLHLGNLKKALEDSEAALKLEADNPDIHWLRYHIYYKIEYNFVGATQLEFGIEKYEAGVERIKSLDRVIELKPDESSAYYVKGNLEVQTLYQLYRRDDRRVECYELSISNYTKAIELDPGVPDYRYARAKISVQQAFELIPNQIIGRKHPNKVSNQTTIQKLLRQAVEDLDIALNTQPQNDPQMLFLKGSAYYGLNEFDKAQVSLDKALSIGNVSGWKRSHFLVLKGICLLNDGWSNDEYILEIFDNALIAAKGDKSEINSFLFAKNRYCHSLLRSRELYFFRGCGNLLCGQYRAAIKDFKQLYLKFPNFVIRGGSLDVKLLEFVYSIALLGNKDYFNALTKVNQVLKSNFLQKENAYFLRGIIYREMGRADKAEDDFREAEKLGFKNALDHIDIIFHFHEVWRLIPLIVDLEYKLKCW